MSERLAILRHFIATRWLPAPGPRARKRRLRRFLDRVRRESSFYREREEFPILTKAEFLAHFSELNAAGITLETASGLALRAERERDFTAELPGGITVGLSSGTSGSRHVFLVSREERCRWAGQMFARMLERASLEQLLNPFAPPLRLAFFLRASSRLYTTLASRRLRFDYYDLLRPFADLMDELARHPPDILVAPATVLAAMARAEVLIRPRQLISVAEVLDDRDRTMIEKHFAVRVRGIYQATEGFLGADCEAGSMHLNEETLHIEPLWIDESHERFHPLITDFSRSTQWFVRYRLDDILCIEPGDCPCGRKSTRLRRIEGRAEETLWLADENGDLVPVFPDVLRRALYACDRPPQRYRIEQHGRRWEVRLSGGSEESIRGALAGLVEGLKLTQPEIAFLPWCDQSPGEKEKRIRCISRPA